MIRSALFLLLFAVPLRADESPLVVIRLVGGEGVQDVTVKADPSWAKKYGLGTDEARNRVPMPPRYIRYNGRVYHRDSIYAWYSEIIISDLPPPLKATPPYKHEWKTP